MLKISDRIRRKLKEKHDVEVAEVEQCFLNRERGFLVDQRPQNRTVPPTRWFIEETDAGRKLLISFIYHAGTGEYEIKTAYEPNPQEVRIYEQYATR